jgi:putative long chain acyl-CoA synthase
VLEFYASTEGTLVLANASGEKVGALGRPLPGSTEAAVAAWDPARGEIARDALGRARRAGADVTGLLVARLDPALAGTAGRVARDLFEPGDAWLMTRDLCRRDADGDYWLVARTDGLIRTAGGPVPGRPIEEALDALPEVALAVAYGVREPGGAADVPAAAIVLRPGATLDTAAAAKAIAERLPPEARPRRLRVVDAVPMTEGFRPLTAALAAGSAGDDVDIDPGELSDHRPVTATVRFG